ncbi:basic proline-rich protein-like [Amphibalanus amphitrite]|uniref:basic proline-rich protein-like n=1 Tax=Amphibalanus amphitrite TaxID=1232801 RepID=UPI001C905FBA|nr:basic proline-rich protein-like [Amphibalanus amphitrite]
MRSSRRHRILAMGPAALWLGSLAAAAADDVTGDPDDVTGGSAAAAACAGDWSCEPPPDFRLLVPPPPVPEYMQEYVERLHQASGECLLCTWAAANDSDPLTGPEEAAGGSSSWIPVLVAVALLSALVGAVVMVVLIRCRRWRVLPSKGLCPLDSADQAKESPPPPPASKPPDDGSAVAGAGAGAAPGGWAMPWRRSERRPPAPGEHGFGGGPYSMPDQDSVVYAELNSVGASRAAAQQPYLLNTYSEIGEPRRLMPDGTYENAGYLVDGPAGGESAGSDPSSAYYSDASGGEPTRLSRRGRPRAGAAPPAAVRRRLPLATRPAEPPLQPLPPDDPRLLHAAIVEPTCSYDVPAEAAPDADSGPRSGDSGNRSGSEPASPERRRPPRLPLPRLPGRRPRPAPKRTSPDRPPPPPPQLYCSEYV